MEGELQSSDLIDPLKGYSTLSLLSRTFRDLKKTGNSEQTDMESIHSYLKSLTLKSPNKLLEQAKTILHNSSEIQNCEFLCHAQPEDKGRAISALGKDLHQERRPALGRKRARFSLKPISSQPSLDEDTSLNIGQLQDPEDFFSAFEKLENAKKELQKQRGEISTDNTQHNQAMAARSRRPGILGKSVGYKHRYSAVPVDSDEVIAPSVEMFEVGTPGPSNNSLNPYQHGTSQERELAGDGCIEAIQDSVAKTKNRANSLLDELLSTNCTDLDRDGALTFLQERLQVKPIKLEKLCLPDLDGIWRGDVRTSVDQLPRPRKSLSNIQNMIARVNSKVSLKKQQVAESSTYPQASPTPPKSPFSAMSLLKRHILQTDLSGNPFSFHGIDVSPARNSSFVKDIDKQAPSPQVVANHLDASNPTPAEIGSNGSNFMGKVQSPRLEENSTASCDMDLENLLTEDVGCPLEPMDDNSSRPITDIDFRPNGPVGSLKDKVGDMQQEVVASKELELSLEDLTTKSPHCSASQLDKPDPSSGKQHPMSGHSEIVDILTELNNEKPSGISLNEQGKQKATAHNRRKRKELSHRKSLAGAGTVWESGVRRSSRIRMRPLEYWRGERFLYGRVHDSLLTVIGVKYKSPTKGDGKGALKVKSYVSDEYEELVEQAARH